MTGRKRKGSDTERAIREGRAADAAKSRSHDRPAPRAHYDIKDIKHALNEDVRGVLDALGVDLRRAKKNPSGYVLPCPFPGIVDKNPSFQIWTAGVATGGWKYYVTGQTGDLLGLVIEMGFARDLRDARAWALDYLGWDRLGARGMSEQELAKRRADNQRRQEREARKAEKTLRANRGRALAAWTQLPKGLIGTGAEDYLLEARGIDLSDLPDWCVKAGGPGPLRFNPSLRYGPRCDDKRGVTFTAPAIVALISGPDGAPLATHRTYLRADCTDKLDCADHERPRLIWPSYAGGVIRLSKGVSKLSPEEANERVRKGDLRHARPVIIVEGWEDGLVNMIARPDLRIWCALSLSNLANVPDMPCVSDFIVWQDGDWGNAQAEAGFRSAIARLMGHGKPVKIVPPSRNRTLKDANDIYRHGDIL